MSDWERELDKRLKGLPPLKAPPALLSAVMNRVEARTRWAWWTWSWGARAASLPVLAAGAGSIAFVAGRLLSLLTRASWAAGPRALNALVAAHSGVSMALGRAFWEVLAAFGQPLLIPAGLAYLICAGAAVAVWQLSLRVRPLRNI